MDLDSSLALLAELNLGSAKGGKKAAAELDVEIVRALTEADLPALIESPPVSSPGQRLAKIRHSHHQLAQLLVKGCSEAEASLITGYSPSYISILKSDPAFNELLDHYRQEREAVFVDVLERMRILGLSTLDELTSRLEEAPEAWSRRELMEMADLMLLKPQQGRSPAGAGSAGPAISVNVKFVTAGVAPQAPAAVVEAVDLDWKDLPS